MITTQKERDERNRRRDDATERLAESLSAIGRWAAYLGVIIIACTVAICIKLR